MQYQIRSKLQIHSIDKEKIDLLAAVEHFAKYGYEYLYIMENGVIVDSISYHEFVKYGLCSKTRNYVIEKKQVEKIGIDKYITTHYEFSRIVVVDDDEFQYEINLMTEPELLHCIEREFIALRIMPLFAQEVKQQLQQYSVITVFADDHVSDFLQKNLLGINFEFVKDLSEIKADAIECVLDYKYGKKLLSKVMGEYTRVEIYSLVEKAAMGRLIDYAEKHDLILRMYRIPDYDQISNLSANEKCVAENKIPFLDLINDKDYLEEFCLSEDDKKFVSMRGASKSVRWDSGIDIIQGDCKEFGIEVSEGTRKTSLYTNGGERTVHFFGPCIVFGMLVVNDETIPAYFEKICIEKHREMSVLNHGGLNGNNVINSIMGALITPMKKNDVIIIIDFFNDLPKEDYLCVQDLCEVFNLSDEKSIRFLDQPVHCNSLANRLIADHLYKQLIECHELGFANRSDKYWIYDKDLVALRDFSATHCVAIKAREILKKLIYDQFGKVRGVVGVIILTDFMEKERIRCLMNEALTECVMLILYYAFEHLELSEQLAGIGTVEEYAVDKRVLVRQLSPYFNAQNYGTGHIFGNKLYGNSIEKDLIESVLIPNHIDVRFFYKKTDDMIADEYKNNGIDVKMICV
ncbi:MAG: hypothetical protein HFH82_10510 [Lachnospiraceae bacterium]|nr:hypothetical protein [Lachnospiraceae bacterium]